jgi:hypothetical protein
MHRKGALFFPKSAPNTTPAVQLYKDSRPTPTVRILQYHTAPRLLLSFVAKSCHRVDQAALYCGLDSAGSISLVSSVSAHLFVVEVSMNPKFDIFKKTGNSVVWVEAAEDIVAAKKRLISLNSTTPGDYKLWDSSRQEFINPMDDCA